MAFLLSLHFIVHFNRQNHDGRWEMAVSLWNKLLDLCFLKLSWNWSLFQRFLASSALVKGQFLDELGQRKKEEIHASLAFLYQKRKKKTWDHIRQENNAHSL